MAYNQGNVRNVMSRNFDMNYVGSGTPWLTPDYGRGNIQAPSGGAPKGGTLINLDPLTGGPGKKPPGMRSPDWKDFSPITSGGNLLDKYSMDPSTLEGYGQFKDLATGSGLTGWGQAAQDALDTRLNFDREALMRQGQSATGQAMSNLMSQGGLTSGARERIQRGGIKDTLSARQQASQSGLLGSADIAMRDAGIRQGALGGLLELGYKGRGADIDLSTGDIQDRRGFEMDKFKIDAAKEMAKYKADEMRSLAPKEQQPGLVSRIIGGIF